MGLEFAVNVTITIVDQLDSEDLVSEARWERGVVQSLLLLPECSTVYLVEPAWKSTKPLPDKLRPFLPEDKQKDVILISPSTPLFDYSSRVLVIGSSGLALSEELKQAQQRLGKGLVIIHPENNPGREAVYPGFESYYSDILFPRIPYTVDKSNFHKNILLWPHKGLLADISTLEGEHCSIFEWAAQRLLLDRSLEFHLLTKVSPAQIKVMGWNSVEEMFWSQKATRALFSVRERVCLYPTIGWKSVLDLYSKTKLLLPHPVIQFGGASLESSMYGIPSVDAATRRPWGGGPLRAAPNYISVDRFGSSEMFAFLDRFMEDPEFYNFIGSSYRKFVDQRYTYASWGQNLLTVLRERNLIGA